MRCLRARVIRSLFHLYEPFDLRISKIPALPETTPTTLLNSKVIELMCRQLANYRDVELKICFYFVSVSVQYS